MKKISIVIVNYKGQKDTVELLESLLKIEKSGHDLFTVVVDNFPGERISLNEDKYKHINLKIIYNEENLGFSGGNNVGIKEALKDQSDYILLLNNDTIVKENFLQNLFDFAEKKPKAGLVVPKIYFAKGYEFHKNKYSEKDLGKVFWYAGGVMDWENVIGKHRGVDEVDHGQYDEVVQTDFASGCCVLIRRSVFEKIGFLDEKYFLYYEDSDFSQRAKKESFEIFYVPTSVIYHKNAGSSGGSGSKLQDYFITRNRLLFGNKYAPLRSRLALSREGIGLAFHGREWQKKGAMDYYLHRFGKGRMDL
jgi:GT2 family glycosyltransferase